jgi:hypothetical protein
MIHLKRFDEDVFGSAEPIANVFYPTSDIIDDENDEHDKKEKRGFHYLNAIRSLDSDGEQLIDAYPGSSMYPSKAKLRKSKLKLKHLKGFRD